MTSPTTEAPKKSASAEILDKVLGIHAAVLHQQRLTELAFSPERLRVYKPTKDPTRGAALSLDIRLRPTFEKTYVKDVAGGVFLVLARQKPGLNANGNAEFDWEDRSITAKLGVVDLSSILVAMEHVRLRSKPVPEALQPRPRPGQEADPKASRQLQLFHKFEEGDSAAIVTVIKVEFAPDGSIWTLSRGKDDRHYIKLALAEELRVRYGMVRALNALEMLGVR